MKRAYSAFLTTTGADGHDSWRRLAWLVPRLSLY